MDPSRRSASDTALYHSGRRVAADADDPAAQLNPATHLQVPLQLPHIQPGPEYHQLMPVQPTDQGLAYYPFPPFGPLYTRQIGLAGTPVFGPALYQPFPPVYDPTQMTPQHYDMANTGVPQDFMNHDWRQNDQIQGRRDRQLRNRGPVNPEPGRFDQRGGPVSTQSPVSFQGFVPSTYEHVGMDLGRVFGRKIHAERERARRNLPQFLTEDELSDDVNIYYAKYGGKFVEVNDWLIGHCVCPCDLLQYPCRWDEFREGCRMLRLCSQVSKYTNYTCPDGDSRNPDDEGFEPSSCPFLHWEVDPSCRFVLGDRECEIVTRKGFHCSAGHDLQWGRKIARERFENHVKDALEAGAVGKVASHAIVFTGHRHRRMQYRPERSLPQPLELRYS